ncbi:hypothetical protein A3D78_02315 [Candidatus Gottesmanbacteria bacterium RIFCSPHIGHO2_02_FULL_39_14]|uniref:Uncharacterized protein n=1 Tax=Candidatus Gottesmanbacteria bacterium RIFCSPHIGHO2_02_FULL_39_14 TaxID=1798383 RepID=A0A1F6A2C6_9BACT|nr:MAG: hypothetical protein A3D78_02315 [Candidatus Gottesmanbacteria bacterium RIFCSPHIGHO2_02_FULL_39_14]
MIDLEGVRIKSTGIDLRVNQRKLVAQTFLDTMKQTDTELLEKLTPAKLSPEETNKLQTVETAVKEFLTAKMVQLGIPIEDIHLPFVKYIDPRKEDKKDKVRRFGYHGGLSIVCVIIDHATRGDLFNAFLATAHELSHASTAKEARLFWKDKQGKSVIEKESIARGLGITGGQGEGLGIGLENGLAICDQIDFCNGYLRNIFPADYKKRLKWIKRIKKRRDFIQLNSSEFGPIPEEVLVPFIFSQSPKVGFLSKLEVPILKDDLLKNYMFIRKIAIDIGRTIVSDQSARLSDKELFNLGRNYLDRHRYSRTNEAHGKIVELYGGKKARIIFKLGDSGENIEEAMHTIINP